MPYTDWAQPHAGSAEVLFTGMFDEIAGAVARTVPRGQITSGAQALAGTGQVQARLIVLPAGLPVNKLTVLSGTTAEAGGSHFWAGLTDLQSNVLFVTADQTGATYVTASTLLANNVTVPGVISQTGPYYYVVSVSAATTMPTMAGGPALAAGAAAPAPQWYGTMGTQAAPPAVGQQLAAIGGAGNGINFAGWIS